MSAQQIEEKDPKSTPPHAYEVKIEDGDQKDQHYDDILPGSEGVSQRDLDMLRSVPDRLPARIWLAAFVEFAERWSYYGTVNIFNNYVRQPLPRGSKDGHVIFDRVNGQAGALGLGTQKAFAVRTFNSFWVYVTPFIGKSFTEVRNFDLRLPLGAFVADLRLGRYNTIVLFSVVCLAGHIILIGSATPRSLENTNAALGLLILSIFIMGLGAGSIKSCVSPLIAEQYTGKLRKETLPSGEVVIKSPDLTYQSIYLWFYLFINLGALGSIGASFLARDHGYWQAFLVPICIFLLVPFIMLAGRSFYIITPPRGSILLETIRVLKMCIQKQASWNPIAFLKGLRSETFYDVAQPGMYESGSAPEIITWDDEFVGEVARTVKACYVFLCFPFYWLCYSQIDNNLTTVSGGLTLNGTPNDVVQNLNSVSLVFFIPIMDFFVYPALRKAKVNFSPIKRIAFGFFIVGSGMVYAAVLQKYIYETSPCHDNRPSECVQDNGDSLPSPINVWVVVGPYIIIAISEIFASITSLEYAFTKAPKRMRSVVMAFAQFQVALSSALNFALTAVQVEELYTWLFGSFAVVAFIVGILFYILFRAVDKAEAEMNAIGKNADRKGYKGETREMTTGVHSARAGDAPPEDITLHTVAEKVVHPLAPIPGRRSHEA